MKTNLKRISRRTISLILCVLMLFSTLMVSNFTANAKNNYDQSDAVIFLKPNTNWTDKNPRYAAYFFDSVEKWVDMQQVGTTGYYYCQVPTDIDCKQVIFCRMNPETTENDWKNKWDQTIDLNIGEADSNCYTVKEGTWNQGGGNWSAYQLDSTAELTASPATVKTNETVTITPTISETKYNNIYDVSYSISPTSGAEINKNSDKSATFTATTAGTYTVTATVTYNAKGFTGIKKQTTATKEITVKAATYTGLDVGNTGKGTVIISADNCTIGGSVNITATPATGYKFAGWTATNGTFGSEKTATSTTANTTFTPTANNAKATATFTENLYDVTVDDGETSTTVQAGVDTHPTIIAEGKPNYTFTGCLLYTSPSPRD